MPKARANGIELDYEVFGPKSDAPPILNINGLGGQRTRWPEFVEALAATGRQVITFDNRDVGLSQKFDAAGAPDLAAVRDALAKGTKPPVAYIVDDMAADAIGLLDALNVPKAHIVGTSMGGMIAQMIAALYPDRVLSLTSIMSSTGNPNLPPAAPEAMAVLVQRGPDPNTDFEGFLANAVKGGKTIGSPAYPLSDDFFRTRAAADFKRSFTPLGTARQMAAITASGDRRAALKKITAPTVVIHGEADPLVPLAGGRDTAENIPGAELIVIPGMGHDLPPGVVGEVVAGVKRAIARAN